MEKSQQFWTNAEESGINAEKHDVFKYLFRNLLTRFEHFFVLKNTFSIIKAPKTILVLIIFLVDFKEAFWISADGAYFGSFCAHNDMTAVTALPHFNLAFFKNLGSFNIFKQSTVTLLVMLFNLAHHTEFCG